MAESPSALPDEQLRCLSPADQAEILNAVAQGRAVSDARLAPLAVAYAHRWHSVGGTRLYRSVWYLGVAALVLAVSFTAAEWPGWSSARRYSHCVHSSRGAGSRARGAPRHRTESFSGGHRIRHPECAGPASPAQG